MRGRKLDAFSKGTAQSAVLATLDITISRGGKLDGDFAGKKLPYVLFNPASRANEYRDIIAPIVPAGLTYVGLVNMDNGNLRFVYEDGAGNEGFVEIASEGAPYSFILEKLNTDLIEYSSFKYNVQNVSQLNQNSIKIQPIVQTIFGAESRTSYTPITYQHPGDNNQTQILVAVSDKVDNSSGWLSAVGINDAANAGNTVTVNFFISNYIRYDANLLNEL